MGLPPLYPHQERSNALIRRAWLEGARRIVVVLPCGAGKTRLATEVFGGGLRKGRRMLWLADREELIEQAARSLRNLGAPCGIIKAGRPMDPTAPIQVASVQTLHARPEALPEDISLIASDECHHDKARTREALFGRYPRDRIELLLGLTATPQRGDRKPLGEAAGGVYQVLIVGATVAELQNTKRPDGHPILVPMRVKGPKSYQQELFRHPIAGLVEFGRRADGSLRPSLLFHGSVEESIAANETALKHGIRSAHVDGKTKDREREDIFNAIREGRLDLVNNVNIATEGFDAPRIEVVGIARGCEAESTFIQMVMRAGRSSPETGKTEGLLIDYRGVSHIHGTIEEERKFSLDGIAIERAEKTPLRQCPRCGSVFKPRPVCPDCSYVMPVERTKQKVKERVATDITHVEHATQEQKFARFQAICALAAERGWQPVAVGMRFKAIFGHWPTWQIPGFKRKAKGAAA